MRCCSHFIFTLASAQALAQIQASREQFAREQRAREKKRKHAEIEELREVRLREAHLHATGVGRRQLCFASSPEGGKK